MGPSVRNRSNIALNSYTTKKNKLLITVMHTDTPKDFWGKFKTRKNNPAAFHSSVRFESLVKRNILIVRKAQMSITTDKDHEKPSAKQVNIPEAEAAHEDFQIMGLLQ